MKTLNYSYNSCNWSFSNGQGCYVQKFKGGGTWT